MDNSDDGWNTCLPAGTAIFESLTRLYQKLKDLGFTYVDGKVVIVEPEEEDSDA